MEKFNEILLDVWREACRNIEITESLPRIAQMLVKHLPLKQILIRRIDTAHLYLDTLATGLGDTELKYFASQECSRSQIKKLEVWHANHSITDRNHCSSDYLSCLLPCDEGNDFLIGALGKQKNVLPFLLMIARNRENFEPRHIEMMKVILEPFTIAVENDRQLREIVKLREAAEADKKTLLTKLSRKKIGDTIIGAETGLKTVMERVELVSNSDVSVLIFGETGTGKELISRSIHNKSDRSGGPCIRVNCGAIPPELIDSHLFGHEKGAFTGAVETRKGWFEKADGGTLFLDEVGELPLKAQVRFLRILQDGRLERVGGKHPIKIDVRIVLATNSDLVTLVSKGRFREDLWYRISTFPIFLPPLRERLEDLKALADHFAKRSATRFGLPIVLPTEKDIHLLSSYSWPGNIRELGAVIDRAALLGNGKDLQIAKALGWQNSFEKKRGINHKQNYEHVSNEKIWSLDDAVREHIKKALIHSHGQVEGEKGAAKLLDINPHTLRARMRKLRIDWSEYRK